MGYSIRMNAGLTYIVETIGYVRKHSRDECELLGLNPYSNDAYEPVQVCIDLGAVYPIKQISESIFRSDHTYFQDKDDMGHTVDIQYDEFMDMYATFIQEKEHLLNSE